MDTFRCIEAFVRVAECRNFAEAARQLGVTPSVITSRVRQLEKFVQAQLFHRSTRTVMLSEAGSYFLKEYLELVSHLDSVVDGMRTMKTTPTGVLRLQVLPGLALGHLGSALKDFSATYPSVDLDIIVSDVAANPVDKGYDVALQIFRPGAETLIERPSSGSVTSFAPRRTNQPAWGTFVPALTDYGLPSSGSWRSIQLRTVGR